jgi:hypothetical protein
MKAHPTAEPLELRLVHGTRRGQREPLETIHKKRGKTIAATAIAAYRDFSTRSFKTIPPGAGHPRVVAPAARSSPTNRLGSILIQTRGGDPAVARSRRDRNPALSGSPAGRPAKPPRIRTCGIAASGSSGVGLATFLTYPLAQSSSEVPVRASPSASSPVLLPARVSFRGLVSSVSLPSFPRVVPTPPGAALCSAGSLGSVPPLPRSYGGTPTSPAPGDARLPRTAVSSSSLGDGRPPRFLGSPCLRAMALDPGGASAPRSADWLRRALWFRLPR